MDTVRSLRSGGAVIPGVHGAPASWEALPEAWMDQLAPLGHKRALPAACSAPAVTIGPDPTRDRGQEPGAQGRLAGMGQTAESGNVCSGG